MVEGLFNFLFYCESGIKEWYIRNANLPFRKDFKFAELLIKTSFFLDFRDRSKNGEGNKLRRRRKYMRKSN